MAVATEPTLEDIEHILGITNETPPKQIRGLKSEIRKQPEASVEIITPEVANEWLGANIKNRDLRVHRVMKMASILARGEWELTQDGVGFDTAGNLINGQHRLSAIVVAGKAAQLVVVRGLKAKSQDVMDSGLSRSLADALKLRGEKNIFVLSASLQWLWRLSYIETTGNVHYATASERPTTPQCLAVLADNPELRELPKSVGRLRRDVPIRAGVATALWYRFRQIDAKEADIFFESLGEGAGLKKTDPIFVLRRLLIADARRGYERLPDWREAALICKAWNAWRDGKPVTQLAYKYTATVKEPFPLPR